jgi:hypothetical protein
MKLKKDAKIGEILETKSGKKVCWNGFAWEKVAVETPTDIVFTRKTSQDVVREIPDGEINDINYIYTLQGIPLSNSEQVYLNGVLQKRGTVGDYTVVEKRLYFVEPPMVGSTITCTYSTSSNTERRGEIPVGDIDGENEVFILHQNPANGTEHVFLNGILQQPGLTGDYTLEGNTLIFNEAPAAGSVVICDYNFV